MHDLKTIGRIALLGLFAALIGSIVGPILAVAFLEYDGLYSAYAAGGRQFEAYLSDISYELQFALAVSWIYAIPITLVLGTPLAFKFRHHAARQPWRTASLAAIAGMLIPLLIIGALMMVIYPPFGMKELPIGVITVLAVSFGAPIGFAYALLVARYGQPRAIAKTRRQ